MAKVITSMLKFPPDQAQKVLEKEDSKMMVSIRLPAEDTFTQVTSVLLQLKTDDYFFTDSCMI